LTPLADLGRSAGQAPLHRLHAAGIAAANEDAEIGARLFERARIGKISATPPSSARVYSYAAYGG